MFVSMFYFFIGNIIYQSSSYNKSISFIVKKTTVGWQLSFSKWLFNQKRAPSKSYGWMGLLALFGENCKL